MSPYWDSTLPPLFFEYFSRQGATRMKNGSSFRSWRARCWGSQLRQLPRAHVMDTQAVNLQPTLGTNKRETNLDLLPNPPGYTETQIRSTVVQSRSGFDTPQNHWPLKPRLLTFLLMQHAVSEDPVPHEPGSPNVTYEFCITGTKKKIKQTSFSHDVAALKKKKGARRESKDGAFSLIFSLIFT